MRFPKSILQNISSRKTAPRATQHVQTKAYLENKMVRMLPNWPPQSPDISIIENVLNSVKQLIANRDISTCEQLWTAVKEEWDHLSKDFTTNLYESLPKRNAEGYNTKF